MFLFIITLPSVFAQVESPIFKTHLALLIIPIGFRLTCYYFRGWYSKHIFGRSFSKRQLLNLKHIKYTGEWWVHKLHRYFLIAAIGLLILHFYDAVINVIQNSGHLYLSNILEWLDVIFLSMYVFGCHSFRHILGGNLICFGCKRKTRYKDHSWQYWLNQHHGLFFWISIITIIVLELYVRLMTNNLITDLILF